MGMQMLALAAQSGGRGTKANWKPRQQLRFHLSTHIIVNGGSLATVHRCVLCLQLIGSAARVPTLSRLIYLSEACMGSRLRVRGQEEEGGALKSFSHASSYRNK